uniref:E3 ubiquitin-protein ligase CHFR n=1 Tax=Crassostrea virginica TaxID=6565 RepID=A0A8B8EG90_CRAVI|nr:E3 ubiquitin-protein ligase CHFR-like isoform X1 [Crassostrea virginica]
MEGEAWGQLVSLTDVLSEPVLLTRDRLTIGRAPDCDISFPGNKLVSGHHCTVEKDEGQVWLRDSSTNGTLLNLKVKVSKGNKKQLSHGDEFYVVHKKDNEELNIGYIYQNMEELKKEESQDATQEYSTEEYLDATLADEDVNDVEEDTRDDESKPMKRTFESSPTEPAKRLKSERSIKSDKDPEKAAEESTDSVKKVKSESTKEEKKTDGEGTAPSGRGVGGEEEGMDQMEEVLVCTICQEIMHDCVSLQPCMHTFCAGCYSDWMKRSQECPSCRMSVDRISKNHIVNNLIEAYLKEHPGKKRSEEDIKDLDARNKISRDMLYPKELKGIEYDPDESVEDSDDYEEDSDEVVNEPPRPLTGPPVAYGGGLFGNWNPMRFVCRQCPNYRDPNTPGTGVLGTVFNTVRTALGINQGNNPPSTGGDEPGPSTDNPSEHDNQATQPTTSTDEPIPDFEERKKKDDMKPEVVAPQYACAVNQNHILCQCCLQPMPDRRTSAGIQQQCCLCLRVYCHAYWGCKKAQCLGCIGKFKDITLGRKCLINLILENLFESEILKNYLEEKKMTLNEMRDVCMQKLDEGTYKCIDQNRARLSSESTVCYPCALRNFRDLAYAFRADIKKEDLPENVRRRNDCYWGKNCRTQRNKPHHAQNFNHICEQTRTS